MDSANKKELLKRVLEAVVLVGHTNPDADCIMALVLANRVREAHKVDRARITFSQVNVHSLEEYELGLDMGASGEAKYGIQPSDKGGHYLKAGSPSASAAAAIFTLLPENEQKVLGSLVKEISDRDNQIPVTHPFYSGLLALHSKAIGATVGGVKFNAYTLLKIYEILVGVVLKGLADTQRAEEAAIFIEWHCNNAIAVLPLDAPVQTTLEAWKHGARIVIFSSHREPHDDFSKGSGVLGVTRNKHLNEPNLGEVLEGLFPEAYRHPDGFMMGWSGKAALPMSRKEFLKFRATFINKVLERLTEYLRKEAA
jgi:hypothetical protein